MKSNNYGIAMLIDNQAMKEGTINQAIMHIDDLINKVITKFVDQLPDAPRRGQAFILKDQHIAIFTQHSRWIVEKVPEDTIFFVKEDNGFFYYEDDKWIKVAS